mmetsp:Transcript_25815/g.39001  ORF Transcript_25815/g.39001 Transcript_25815/m.39001 type:complete len:127 (+) Transcript_25815:99-479(+)
MERRDYDYYEANVADINLRQITSCEGNAEKIRRLLGDDDTLRHLTLGTYAGWSKNYFHVGKGDDLGWLGYFIGQSEYFHHLFIRILHATEKGGNNKFMPLWRVSPAVNLFERLHAPISATVYLKQL